MGIWSAITIAAAVLAALLPICALARRPTGIARAMKEGGLPMLALLLLQFVIPVIVTVLGVTAIRGRKIPSPLFVVVALVPSLVALLSSAYAHATTVRSLNGDSVDPGDKLRIADLSLAEAGAPLLYSALICAFALLVVAIAATGIVASVDRARVGVTGGIAWLASLVVSLAFIIPSVGYAVFTKAFERAPLAFLFSIGAALTIAILAALASHSAACFRGWHDSKEASQMAGAILVAALAAALVLASFDGAILISSERYIFNALSGQSVERSYRVAFSREWLSTSRALAVVAMIQVVGVLAAFAPALVRASGRGTSPFSVALLPAIVFAVLVPAAFVAFSATQHAYIRRAAAATRTPRDPVVLPNVGTLRTGAFSQTDRIVVSTDTVAFSPPIASLEDHTFAVDKDVTMEALIKLTPIPVPPAVAPRYKPTVRETHFLVDALDASAAKNASSLSNDPEIVAIIGEFRPALGAVIEWSSYDGTSRPSIVIGEDGKLIVTPPYTGAEAVLTLSPDLPQRLSDVAQMKTYSTSFYVIVQPTTTMDTLAHVIAAVQKDDYHEIYLSVAHPH